MQVVDFKKYSRYFCFEITDPRFEFNYEKASNCYQSNAFNKWHKIFALCASTEEEMNTWLEAISDYSGENDPVGFTSGC